MKKLSTALFSSAFAISAASAETPTVVITPEPLEVVVTAKLTLVGKNIFNYTVLDNAPEKSVTIVDLHTARNERTVYPCEVVAKYAAIYNRMSPEARLGAAFHLIDESRDEKPVKLTISDVNGPVDPAAAKEKARLLVAGFAIARFDTAMQKATQICSAP